MAVLWLKIALYLGIAGVVGLLILAVFVFSSAWGGRLLGRWLELYLEGHDVSWLNAKLNLGDAFVSPGRAKVEALHASLGNPLDYDWRSQPMIQARHLKLDVRMRRALASGFRTLEVESLQLEHVKVVFDKPTLSQDSNFNMLLDTLHAHRRQMPATSEGEPLWTPARTLFLGDKEALGTYLGSAEVLDSAQYSSVRDAVWALNQGGAYRADGSFCTCEEGLCVVFSASCEAYYLLYRRGQREKALWSAARTALLCSRDDAAPLERFKMSGRLIDETVTTSAAQAVEFLSEGRITCPEGFCAVFSQSHDAYYVLFQYGKEEEAWPWVMPEGSSAELRVDMPPAAPPLQFNTRGVADAHELSLLEREEAACCGCLLGFLSSCTNAICRCLSMCCCCSCCFGAFHGVLKWLVCFCCCHFCGFDQRVILRRVRIKHIDVEILLGPMRFCVSPKNIKYDNFTEEVGAYIFDDILRELMLSFAKTIVANVTCLSTANDTIEGASFSSASSCE